MPCRGCTRSNHAPVLFVSREYAAASEQPLTDNSGHRDGKRHVPVEGAIIKSPVESGCAAAVAMDMGMHHRDAQRSRDNGV